MQPGKQRMPPSGGGAAPPNLRSGTPARKRLNDIMTLLLRRRKQRRGKRHEFQAAITCYQNPRSQIPPRPQTFSENGRFFSCHACPARCADQHFPEPRCARAFSCRRRTAHSPTRSPQPGQSTRPVNQAEQPSQAAGSVGTADSSAAAAAASSRCFSLRIAQYSNTIGSTLTKMIPSVTKKKFSWTAGMLPTQ